MSNTKLTNPKDIIGSGKVPLELVPDTMMIALSMAFLEGAVKYGRYNWRVAGVRASIYVAALRRHLAAWWNGEDLDSDSGLIHLWKASACLAVIIDAQVCDKLVDDRPPRAPITEMMDKLLPMVGRIKEMYKDKNPHQYTIADTPENVLMEELISQEDIDAVDEWQMERLGELLKQHGRGAGSPQPK